MAAILSGSNVRLLFILGTLLSLANGISLWLLTAYLFIWSSRFIISYLCA